MRAVRLTPVQVTILIVDDASEDKTASLVRGWEIEYPFIKLITNRINVGRSGARNAGIRAGKSPWVFMLDVDCMPVHPDFLRRFIDASNDSTILYSSQIAAIGENFWAQYSQKVYERRRIQYEKSSAIEFTSACFACRREALVRIGLFSEEYRKYGFEDRDLFVRLSEKYESSTFIMDFDNCFYHAVEDNPQVLLRKMFEAGNDSAVIFRRKFPEFYRLSRYAKIDYKLAPLIKRISLLLLIFLVEPLSCRLLGLLEWKWVPFSIKSRLALTLQAASFCKGTYYQSSDRDKR